MENVWMMNVSVPVDGMELFVMNQQYMTFIVRDLLLVTKKFVLVMENVLVRMNVSVTNSLEDNSVMRLIQLHGNVL